MRAITILFLLLLASPAFSELTKEDLRTVIKEEVRPIIKEEIAASEKRTREHIDLKIETVNARIDGLDKSLNARIDAVDQKLTARIDGLDKSLNARIDDIRIVMIALIGLIAAAIAVPSNHYRLQGKGSEGTGKTAGRSPNRNPTAARTDRGAANPPIITLLPPPLLASPLTYHGFYTCRPE